MKYLTISGGVLAILMVLVFKSYVINDPKPEDCEVITATIVEVKEGTSYDIVFKDTGGDFYYINRGIESGLQIDDLKNSTLNKEATMHLPKFAIGTSEHIAQLTVDGTVLYTEFK